MKSALVRYAIGAAVVAAVYAVARLLMAPPEVAAPSSAPVLDLGHQQGTDAVIKDLATRPK